ncbi:hypothetical protein CAI21_15735 [Alkalilimnicola ehrlichii]|uniref:Uncharacterized protein n=1 Tax=Alkalilimnicola ehrlichii TaxID=351052 RepID=A0A3E0WPJ7_9GAMM|nr:hypothetical protein [Alkalilimnicola ehrlichii]RFA27002.1 hypothetical protein CAI21_15735 [Alkalilimnicola ehrlichii]RFA34123.1 hypothetical protein CAL65_15870 [Alkalilimnicola ehrlichii]
MNSGSDNGGRLFRLACCALAALLTGTMGGCSSRAPADYAAAWPQRCVELKRDLGDEPSLAVTLSDPAAVPQTPQEAWVLNVGGFAVPVPPAAYDRLLIRSKGQFQGARLDDVLMLVAPTGHSVFIGLMPGFETTEDAFATVDWTQESGPRSTKAGKQATAAIWGGPVSFAEMAWAGYLGAPDDLSCRADRWQDEARLAFGLILKRVGSGELLAAYPMPAHEHAVLTLHAIDEGWDWQVLVPAAAGEHALQIHLRLPSSAEEASLGLAIAQPDRINPLASPVWLQALQEAIDSNRPTAWRALLPALEQAGFRSADRERLEVFVESRFGDDD